MPARPVYRRLARELDATDDRTRRVAPAEQARTLRAVARRLADAHTDDAEAGTESSSDPR
jgi:hypothetical protein